jgi:hypothetical protein
MNKLITLAIGGLFLCSTTKAQTLAVEPNTSRVKSSTLANIKDKPTALTSLEQARKQLMQLFNLYRDYSITIDTSSFKPDDPKLDDIISDEKATPVAFGAYLEKMRGVIQKRLAKLNPDEVAERSRLIGGLSLLNSAKCLEDDKSTVNFVRMKDFDGNDIMGYPLDSLKVNSRYGMVDKFKEGYARIKKDQVYGYINLCGQEIVICQYEQAEPYNLGKALVKRVDWYFVDTKNEESETLDNVIDAKSFAHGVSWAKMINGKQALIDNTYDASKKPISQLYDGLDPFYKNNVFRVRNGKKFGLIDYEGKTKLDVMYDLIEPTNMSGIYKIHQNNSIGIIDSTWVIRLTPVYEAISEFNQFGLAIGKTPKGYVVIDRNGFRTSKLYQSISEYNEYGVASIKDDFKNYGLIDANLNVIVQPKYASIGNFNELGLASACYLNGKCGFIKYDGTEQIKAQYESVGSFNKFGLAVATTSVNNCGGKNGEKCSAQVILDRNGNLIVPVTDESIEKKIRYQLTDSLHSERYIVVNAYEGNNPASQFIIIDKDNFQLITAVAYSSISSPDLHGLIRVRKGDYWGIVDTTGKLLTKPIYKDIRRVGEAYYAAENKDGKWGFLNKKGKPQIPFEYEEVKAYRFGYAPVSKGKGKWGLINRFNAKIVPCEFVTVELNPDETKFVVTDSEDVKYVINDQGECETNKFKFEEVRAKANKEVVKTKPTKQ